MNLVLWLLEVEMFLELQRVGLWIVGNDSFHLFVVRPVVIFGTLFLFNAPLHSFLLTHKTSVIACETLFSSLELIWGREHFMFCHLRTEKHLIVLRFLPQTVQY